MSALFERQNFHEVSEGRRAKAGQEIERYEIDGILGRSQEVLEKHFTQRIEIQLPILKLDQIFLLEAPRERTTTDRIRDPMWHDEFVNVTQRFIDFTVCIPFEGDGSFFYVRPMSSMVIHGRRPEVEIQADQLRLIYSEPVDTDDLDLKNIYNAEVKLIETNLQRLAQDVEIFHKDLPQFIQKKLTERIKSASQSKKLIDSIQIPIMKRDDVPTTYRIPEIQKKPSFVEVAKVATFVPEPTLSIEVYENILCIMKDMSLAMERSPKTFQKLKEEEIRDFFIILLNGHYQGMATGETFNGSGKTDIIVRYENQNAFIGECKFWAVQQ